MKNLKQNVKPPMPQQLKLKIVKTGAEKKVAPNEMSNPSDPRSH
jgi:hypothetical protein